MAVSILGYLSTQTLTHPKVDVFWTYPIYGRKYKGPSINEVRFYSDHLTKISLHSPRYINNKSICNITHYLFHDISNRFTIIYSSIESKIFHCTTVVDDMINRQHWYSPGPGHYYCPLDVINIVRMLLSSRWR